jgi:hypothetical protein
VYFVYLSDNQINIQKENNGLLIFARMLPDHRIERKKLHLAEDIVYLTLAAVICGADTWTSRLMKIKAGKGIRMLQKTTLSYYEWHLI